MSNLITFGIYFGVFAVIALTVLRRPAVAMGGMMCMFGLEQWAQSRSSFFFIHQELTNVLMASMLLWGVLARPIKGLPVLRPFPKVAWWVIGLYAFAALSMFWVPEFSLSLKQFKAALPYLLAVGCLMPLVVGDLADLRAGLLMALAVGTPILAMLFFDTRWVGRTVVFDEGAAFGSIRGNTGNPLAVASLAGWVAVTAALMNFRGAARALQVVRWAIVALGVAVLLRSESRGQLFALLIAGVAFLPLSRRVRDLKSFAAASAGMGLFLLVAYVLFQMYAAGQGRWQADEMVGNWQQTRLGTAMVVLREWASGSPFTWIFGLGSSASFSDTLLGGYPHLVAAEALAELGVIGFSLLMTIWVLTAKNLWKLGRRLAEFPEERGLVAVLGALFLFELVLTFKQGSLLGNYFSFGFAMMIGRLEIVTRPYDAYRTGGFPVLPAEADGEYASDGYGDPGYGDPAYGEWAEDPEQAEAWEDDPELAQYLPSAHAER